MKSSDGLLSSRLVSLPHIPSPVRLNSSDGLVSFTRRRRRRRWGCAPPWMACIIHLWHVGYCSSDGGLWSSSILGAQMAGFCFTLVLYLLYSDDRLLGTLSWCLIL